MSSWSTERWRRVLRLLGRADLRDRVAGPEPLDLTDEASVRVAFWALVETGWGRAEGGTTGPEPPAPPPREPPGPWVLPWTCFPW